jgi:hypothetical protein
MNKPGSIVNNIYSHISKVLIFYFPVSVSYWDTLTRCQINNKITSIGKYYLNFRAKYPYPGNFSTNGIPLYNLSDGKEIFNPTVICQYALALFDLMADKDFADKDLNNQFFAQSDWLVSNKRQLRHGQGWYLNYNIPEYVINAPWLSALTQGEAISVLCRAFFLSGKDEYLEAAEKAIIPFEYDVVDGGLCNYFDNIMIFEEYPSQKPNVVLNGWIFAIFGFYDLYLLSSNQTAKKLYDISLDSLEKIIDYFDVNYWSQYNLYHYPSYYLTSYKYHNLHIEQLKALYIISNKDFLKKTYTRWEYYNSKYSFRTKALFKKLFQNN